MDRKIILGVLIFVLLLAAGLAAGNKITNQTKAIGVLQGELSQMTSARDKARTQVQSLKKDLEQANKRADAEESAKKSALAALVVSEKEKEENLKQFEQVEARLIFEINEALEAAAKAKKDGYDEGYKTALTRGLPLRNPTYQELKEFLSQDQTKYHNWIPGEYVCIDFARELDNNAENMGIRAAYVQLILKKTSEGKWYHAINAFETTDKGLVFVEPQTGREIPEKMAGVGACYITGTPTLEVNVIW